MGKRTEHDSTMEMSTSQLVPDAPRHDASVWKQVVVDSDQFAPSAGRGTGRRWALILAMLVGLGLAAAATVYFWPS